MFSLQSQGLCEESCANSSKTILHQNLCSEGYELHEFLADSTRCSVAKNGLDDEMPNESALMPAEPAPSGIYSLQSVHILRTDESDISICDNFSSPHRTDTEDTVLAARDEPVVVASDENIPLNDIIQNEKDQQARAGDISQLIETFELDEDIVASVYESCGSDLEKTVATLSEMTESMGIERYSVFKIMEEGERIFRIEFRCFTEQIIFLAGLERVDVIKIAVYLTSASLESLVESCGHTEFSGDSSEVSASPIILNNYPCVEEDLICPFGELVYIKVLFQH